MDFDMECQFSVKFGGVLVDFGGFLVDFDEECQF